MRLVTPDRRILSAYQPASSGGGTGGQRSTLLRLDQIGDGGRLEVSAAASLIRVHIWAVQEGLDLRITDAWRNQARQASARYRWWRRQHRDGPPAPFALPWGQSWHGCGLAVDIDVEAMGAGYDALDVVFRGEGWRQVRDGLRPGDSEAWHWQYPPPNGLDVAACHRALGFTVQ